MAKKTIEPFPQRLARIRKEKGLTQFELAKATGFTRRMIAVYESKIKNIPPQNISPLAKALNVSTDTLLGHTVTKEKNEVLQNRKLIKKLKTLEELPSKDQKSVLDFIDALQAKNIIHKAKK